MIFLKFFMPAHSPSNTLELYDLDGTLNSIDVPGALDGNGSPEVKEYINAAVTFLIMHIPELKGTEDNVLRKIQKGMELTFPKRSQLKYWAIFPNTDKQQTKICPAVDHYLLTPPLFEHASTAIYKYWPLIIHFLRALQNFLLRIGNILYTFSVVQRL